MKNLTGKLVDRYQILELLGQGGMAMVYKAYDPRLEREVALKIIRLEAFPPDDLHDIRKRFEREAKALAQLSHPNIIKVMDYGEHEGSPFLVMEYLQGGTLKQMIGEPMSWQEAMQLLLPIARGLEYAHRRGIVHRDIKPANILMTEDGEPTLSDFGIVKSFQDEKTALTASGAAFYAFHVPEDYKQFEQPVAPGTEQPQGLEPPPSWMMELHAYAEYSLDDGPAKVAGWSGLGFREDGLRLSWVMLDPVPRRTQELTLLITKLGDREGPWEFLVSLE